MFGLFDVRRRAEEQRYTLAWPWHTLADTGERPIELYEATADLRGGRPGAASVRLSSSALRARLSPRQCEVLDLMTSGLSNPEIAERLVVALPTVKSHVRAVLRPAVRSTGRTRSPVSPGPGIGRRRRCPGWWMSAIRLRVPRAELGLEHLSGGIAGKGVDDLELKRELVPADARARELAQFLQVDACARFGHDGRADPLTSLVRPGCRSRRPRPRLGGRTTRPRPRPGTRSRHR
jgi:DNA-binding CsgD family transcriptional regulator